MMKPTSSLPRRMALAIAAASAGLTLAVTATIAGGLGLLAPAAPQLPPTSTGVEQPAQPPLAPAVTDGLASALTGSSDRSADTGSVAPSSGAGDVRLARREHDGNDRRGEQAEKLRRVPLTGASVERTARLVISRDHEDDDD